MLSNRGPYQRRADWRGPLKEATGAPKEFSGLIGAARAREAVTEVVGK
jgi:hypothetical protein